LTLASGQVQPGRDLRVRQALTEARQHLDLAVGERPGQVPARSRAGSLSAEATMSRRAAAGDSTVCPSAAT
jgi:hypothetical protein